MWVYVYMCVFVLTYHVCMNMPQCVLCLAEATHAMCWGGTRTEWTCFCQTLDITAKALSVKCRHDQPAAPGTHHAAARPGTAGSGKFILNLIHNVWYAVTPHLTVQVWHPLCVWCRLPRGFYWCPQHPHAGAQPVNRCRCAPPDNPAG